MKKLPKLFLPLLLSIAFLLSGCCSTNKSFFKKKYFLAQNTYCMSFFCGQLKKRGIIVAQDIHSFYLAIPADKLFIGRSANLSPTGYDILDKIAALFRCCDMEDVKLTGIIQNHPNHEKAFALAMERAKHTQSYLWLQKINASILYSTAKVLPGIDCKKITANDYVVVVFKKMYDTRCL